MNMKDGLIKRFTQSEGLMLAGVVKCRLTDRARCSHGLREISGACRMEGSWMWNE